MMMHQVTAPSGPDSTFHNVGTALREVAAIIARLEDAALHMCGCGAEAASRTKALQDFDLVLQSLADLAGLMETLGGSDAAATNAEPSALIATMRLAWLRDLIGGAARNDTEQPGIAIF